MGIYHLCGDNKPCPLNFFTASLGDLLQHEEFFKKKGYNTSVLEEYAYNCKVIQCYYIGLCSVKYEINTQLTYGSLKEILIDSDKVYEKCRHYFNKSDGFDVGLCLRNMHCFHDLFILLYEYLLYSSPEENIPGDKDGIKYHPSIEELHVPVNETNNDNPYPTNTCTMSLEVLFNYKKFLFKEGYEINILEEYATHCNKYGGYYIGMYDEKLTLKTPLTNIFIENAIKTSNIKYAELYEDDSYNNEFFLHSMENMLKFEELYYTILHYLYRPPYENIPGDEGGIEYQRLLKETLVGKK